MSISYEELMKFFNNAKEGGLSSKKNESLESYMLEWQKIGKEYYEKELQNIKIPTKITLSNCVEVWVLNPQDLDQEKLNEHTFEWDKAILHQDDDLPAVINKIENRRKWYKNGLLHRENDLPAIEYGNETKSWFINGKLHRDNDLPACIHKRKEDEWVVEWYKNGLRHRDNDLPAMITASGHKEWWVDGKLHRGNNLPAIIFDDGSKQFWINGVDAFWQIRQ
jgi:hypothetical protein